MSLIMIEEQWNCKLSLIGKKLYFYYKCGQIQWFISLYSLRIFIQKIQGIQKKRVKSVIFFRIRLNFVSSFKYSSICAKANTRQGKIQFHKQLVISLMLDISHHSRLCVSFNAHIKSWQRVYVVCWYEFLLWNFFEINDKLQFWDYEEGVNVFKQCEYLPKMNN